MLMKNFVTFLFLLVFTIVYSQNISYKFGKVSKEELLMDSCDFYPNADAMVLFNIGNLRIDYVESRGLVYVFEMHQRIKIFTNEGKDYANRSIKYFKGKNRELEDDLSGFKAYTFNLEGNKIKKTILNKKEKYYNELNDYTQELSFVMPNVKKGSILEIKYKITSQRLETLKTWYFQDLIPVKYSNFWYTTPDFLQYQLNNYGNYFPKEIKDKYWTLYAGNYSKNEEGKEFTMKNVTPLEKEPYMGNIRNALSKLEFNLVYIDNKYDIDYDIGTTYEKLNENLVKSYHFGKRLSKGKFSKIWKEELKAKSEYEKLSFILHKIQKGTNWNKHYNLYSEIAGGALFRKKEGDVADINLTLVAALKYHGLKAYPVILRTKDKGIPHPLYPNKYKFNYVVAMVEIDGKEILCDATLDTPPGLIRKECLNNNGWLVDEKGGRWIDLTKDAFQSATILYDVKIKNDSIFNNVKMQFKDYYAYDLYKDYVNGKLENQFKELLPDWEIAKIDFDKNNNKEIFKVTLNLQKEIDDEDLIIIKPFELYTYADNPFKRETRNFVIDFVFKEKVNMIFNMDIPEGYNAEIPESMGLKAEDGGIIYQYVVNSSPQKIAINNRLKFKKTMFAPTEYNMIKVFFDKIVAANNAQIILTKQ